MCQIQAGVWHPVALGLHHLGCALADRGHDVTILTTLYRKGDAREERRRPPVIPARCTRDPVRALAYGPEAHMAALRKRRGHERVGDPPGYSSSSSSPRSCRS